MEAARGGRLAVSRALLLGVSALFAVAMGFLEAIVVVYIRHILGMVPTPVNLTMDVMRRVPRWLINIERVREACTIVMLASLGFLSGRTRAERFGVFLAHGRRRGAPHLEGRGSRAGMSPSRSPLL